MDTAKIMFFRINRCGFYDYGSANPRFGGILPAITDMRNWMNGKNLSQTKTHEVNDGDALLPAYLVSVTALGDSLLITAWNEIEAHEGRVASMNGRSPVGTTDVEHVDLGENAIPGFASYFWVLPALGLIACVRFKHRSTGIPQLSRYVSAFLKTYSSNVVCDGNAPPGVDAVIIGYRENAQANITNAKPGFKLLPVQNPGAIQYLVDHAPQIRKMCRKVQLDLGPGGEPALWQRLLSGVGLADYVTNRVSMDVSYEINFPAGLSEQQVQAVVEHWDEDNEDFAFFMAGDTQTARWLSHSRAKDTLDLDVVWDNEEIVNTTSLLQALALHQDHLLGLVN